MPIVGNTQNATTQTLGETTLIPAVQGSTGPSTSESPLSALSSLNIQASSSSVLLTSARPPLGSTEATTQPQSSTPPGSFITITAVYTYNTSWYSHRTVFVTNEQDASTLANMNAPPLTTVFTPHEDCGKRWMLAGTGQVITRFAPAEVTPILVLPSASASGSTFVHQEYTLFSMNLNGSATDSAYRTCNPYSLQAPTYSPGICPHGQTVAEVTAYQVSASTGYRTFWQASCCRSGFTFGPEYPVACISTVSTPIEAYALVTSTPSRGALPSTVYQYEVTSYISTLSSYTTFQKSSTTTLTTGLAVADPVVIAWQTEDHKYFPSDYAASLESRFDLIVHTEIPSPGLSTGAKAGIGVGAVCGAFAVLGGLCFLLLRRRQKQRGAPSAPQEHHISEMADQDHNLARKKWWTGGKWRSEADTSAGLQELDDQTVHVVPGPPAELDGAELRHPSDAGRAVFPQREPVPLETRPNQ